MPLGQNIHKDSYLSITHRHHYPEKADHKISPCYFSPLIWREKRDEREQIEFESFTACGGDESYEPRPPVIQGTSAEAHE